MALTEKEKSEKLSFVEKIKDWLEIDFRVSIFGVTILSFHFPPLADKKK